VSGLSAGLLIQVCREWARSKCSRSDDECRYAHPPPHVDVMNNGRVMCCFDSIKVRGVYLLITSRDSDASRSKTGDFLRGVFLAVLVAVED